jgi:hypothetical protein
LYVRNKTKNTSFKSMLSAFALVCKNTYLRFCQKEREREEREERERREREREREREKRDNTKK